MAPEATLSLLTYQILIKMIKIFFGTAEFYAVGTQEQRAPYRIWLIFGDPVSADELESPRVCQTRIRSYTNLVIKAHQHGALKTSIRSHSDFWKGLLNPATFDSPKVCKNGGGCNR